MEKLEKENEDEMGHSRRQSQAELCIPSQTDLFQVRIWQIPVHGEYYATVNNIIVELRIWIRSRVFDDWKLNNFIQLKKILTNFFLDLYRTW